MKLWFFFLNTFGAKSFLDFFLAALLAFCGCQLKTTAKLSLTFCTGGTGAPVSWSLSSARAELLSSRYLCNFFVIPFLTSCLLREGSDVTLLMGCYSLFHLPKNHWSAQPSVMSYPFALLARCLEGRGQSSTSWNWCHSVEESSPWHAEIPVINIHCFLPFYLGTSY